MTNVAIQNANLRALIRNAHDAGVEPGTPLSAANDDGDLVELTMSNDMKVTFEILDDNKIGYGLTPKDGACFKFARHDSINTAFEQVHYGGQGYRKIGSKWIKPGTAINDEAIRRNEIKGDWLKLPEFLEDKKDKDGNPIKKAKTELGVNYSWLNLKPETLRILRNDAVLPPKRFVRPKKKKQVAPKKHVATQFPTNKRLINAGTGRKPVQCREAKTKAQIRGWILHNSTPEQLRAVLLLHGITVAVSEGGQALLRQYLRDIWHM